MDYSFEHIEQLALSHLTPDERVVLADRMLNSVSSADGVEIEDDPEFIAEINRRIARIENGTAILHPHDKVMAELRALCR